MFENLSKLHYIMYRMCSIEIVINTDDVNAIFACNIAIGLPF